MSMNSPSRIRAQLERQFAIEHGAASHFREISVVARRQLNASANDDICGHVPVPLGGPSSAYSAPQSRRIGWQVDHLRALLSSQGDLVAGVPSDRVEAICIDTPSLGLSSPTALVEIVDHSAPVTRASVPYLAVINATQHQSSEACGNAYFPGWLQNICALTLNSIVGVIKSAERDSPSDKGLYWLGAAGIFMSKCWHFLKSRMHISKSEGITRQSDAGC